MIGDSAGDTVVVVPIGGGVDVLEQQLHALEAQTEQGFTVVLAVNRRALLAECARLADRSSLRIRVTDASAVPGPAHARNAGWRAVEAELVLFCDADDLCEPGWVAGMRAALAEHDLVRGSIDYRALNPVPFAFTRTDPAEHPTKFGHLPFGPSCCLGLRRSLLETLGGFDERLTAGEDIDLCWRAQYEGAALHWAPGAVVRYRLRQRAATVFAQGVGYGESDAELFRLHRDRGARHTPTATLRDLAALGLLALRAPLGRAHRLKLALETGIALGHVRAFRATGIWVV